MKTWYGSWTRDTPPLNGAIPSARHLPFKTRVLLDALERHVATMLGDGSGRSSS